MQTVDLGAGGVVTAEAFAVEIECEGGKREIIQRGFGDYFAAEDHAAHINDRIAAGSPYYCHFLAADQAYVVAVGEVVAA